MSLKNIVLVFGCLASFGHASAGLQEDLKVIKIIRVQAAHFTAPMADSKQGEVFFHKIFQGSEDVPEELTRQARIRLLCDFGRNKIGFYTQMGELDNFAHQVRAAPVIENAQGQFFGLPEEVIEAAFREEHVFSRHLSMLYVVQRFSIASLVGDVCNDVVQQLEGEMPEGEDEE